MAEPFKNELGEARIRIIASHLSDNDKNFDLKKFLNLALINLEHLSLMERNRQIVESMKACLPQDFTQAKRIIDKSLAPLDKQLDAHGIHSWLAVPISEFLGRYGINNLKEAMQGLAKATPLFSSEWGIRHLIHAEQDKSLQQLDEWTNHESEHVRRLVSEGSRPRLPWGFQLKAFVENPELTFPLLEKLKDDPSDYVRLSVSNHLNDISKDHPEFLQKKMESWLEPNNVQRIRLIKHACRTLIKQGHQPTLNMLGYQPFETSDVKLELTNNQVEFGNKLAFQLTFRGPKSNLNMIIDYAIHFKKANGKNSPKVFKWKVASLNEKGVFSGKKSHSIKPITTRKYYDGEHFLEIFVNGQSLVITPFHLIGVNE